MANQIRIHTACEIIQDNDVTVEGISYSDKKLDGNADSRSWGGNYNISTAYGDADVCYWKNVVVSQTSAGAGLSNSAWTEASDVSDGTIPTTAHVVAVEYVSQLGSDSAITVQVSGETFALLTPGESIVIPMHMGEAVADIEVFDANYSNGTREATVNVMIAGV